MHGQQNVQKKKTIAGVLNQIALTARYSVHAEFHGSGKVVVRHEENLFICVVEHLFGVVRSYVSAQGNKEH